MVGLTRDQMPPADLRPGDVVDYFSPAFVVGDKRGLRKAVITRVQQGLDYPVRVNSGEILSPWAMVKRMERDDWDAPATCWRQIQTFDLVDGTFSAPEAGEQLRRGLARVVADAFLAVTAAGETRAASAAAAGVEAMSAAAAGVEAASGGVGVEAVSAAAAGVEAASAAAAGDTRAFGEPNQDIAGGRSVLPSADIDILTTAKYDAFSKIPTASALRKRHHQANPKNTGGWTGGKSKKARYHKLRVPHRALKHVHNANSVASQFLQQFMKRPHVQEALIALRKSRGHSETSEVDSSLDACVATAIEEETQEPPKVIVPWPAHVIEIKAMMNPAAKTRKELQLHPGRVTFTDSGDHGECECVGECYVDQCLNSVSDAFCTKENCALDALCGKMH